MIVIADDITGAAEIAGIAFARGEQVRLLCSSSVGCDHIAANGMTVVATKLSAKLVVSLQPSAISHHLSLKRLTPPCVVMSSQN